ncbi:MAG: aminotransferase class V-fold PLP-dependent enzyme [Canibacter sp.]
MTSETFNAQEVEELRQEFPYFANLPEVDGKPVAYLDSAATAQRPERVLNVEREFLTHRNAAVHRGTSNAVGEATNDFEEAREAIASLVGAGRDYSVVWTAGATDALNQIAQSLTDATIGAQVSALAVPGSERFALEAGDEILVTEAEHHANLIPWQRLAARTGATLKYIPVNEHGTWSLEAASEALNPRTKVFAFSHVSNVTGWVAPVAELVALTRDKTQGRALTVLDACQSVPHIPVNFSALGIDFAAFSGHKMFGPNGIGVLVGRTEVLNALPPARTGGSAITQVTMEHAEYLPAPLRFEPGTQPVSQVVALGEAARMLQELNMNRVARREHELVARLVEGLKGLSSVRLLGPQSDERVALTAVAVAGLHGHDLGQVLDTQGVLVRTGHHCAQPLHRALGTPSSVRASVHATTTEAEVDRFVSGVSDALRYFQID